MDRRTALVGRGKVFLGGDEAAFMVGVVSVTVEKALRPLARGSQLAFLLYQMMLLQVLLKMEAERLESYFGFGASRPRYDRYATSWSPIPVRNREL